MSRGRERDLLVCLAIGDRMSSFETGRRGTDGPPGVSEVLMRSAACHQRKVPAALA